MRAFLFAKRTSFHVVPVRVALCLFAGWLALSTESFAQAPRIIPSLPGKADIAPPTNLAAGTIASEAAAIQARLDEAQAELARVLALRGNSTNLPAGALPGEAIEYWAVLQSIVSSYRAHVNDLAALESLRQRQRDLDQTVRSWTGFAAPPPYSILLVDELRDSIQSLEEQIRASDTGREALDRVLSDAETTRKESEGRLRRIAEQLETAKDPAAVTRLIWQRTFEQARSQSAASIIGRMEARRRVNAEGLAELHQRLAFARRQLAIAGRNEFFPQSDLDHVLAGLDQERLRIEKDAQTADADQQARQKSLAEAREQLRQLLASTSQAETNDATANLRVRRAQELVEVRSAQAETSAQRLAGFRQMLNIIGTERALWQMRFAAFDSQDLAKLKEAYRRLETLKELITAARPYFVAQIQLAAGQAAEQQNRLQNQATTLADPDLTRELLNTFEQREAFHRIALRSLDKAERLVLRWKDALDADRKALPFTARVQDLFTGASSFASKFWQFELFSAEDTITVDGQKITDRRGITVGKLLTAVLILVLGYLASRVVARTVERLSVTRLKIEPNQARLIRRWVMVVLVLALVVFSLVSVKIPLTVFAFAGGALAIGVGFGTQNLLKNFISGIMILFERPFSVGDILDVGGQRGTLTSIGIRSSILQLWDHTETIIPNSALLENNVTNWTYSSSGVRFSIMVGVAYGSDTRLVAQLLGEVAERHGLVQKEPKPQVLFTDFGESTLNFELRYWVDVLRNNSAQIASDLRHMIAGSFAEHRISIAFPQRELHLNSDRPLQVQVVAPAAVAPPQSPEGSEEQKASPESDKPKGDV